MKKLQPNDMQQFVELMSKNQLVEAGQLLQNVTGEDLSTADGRLRAASAITYSGPWQLSPRLAVSRIYFAMRDHADSQG